MRIVFFFTATGLMIHQLVMPREGDVWRLMVGVLMTATKS